MAKPKVWYFLIKKDALEDKANAVHDIMDMLRYDSAKVVSNPPGEPAEFYLLSTDSPLGPTVRRWESFHLRVEGVGSSPEDALNDARFARRVAPTGHTYAGNCRNVNLR